MGKYTNAWFYKKTDPNHHDCANDGTCGKSITKVAVINGKFVFSDNNEKLIAEVPILLKYSSDKYGHQLYKEAKSKQSNYFSTNIHDVLSNSFTVKYGYINCTIKYDNLSGQEQNQIETDIKTAYEAFKEKFCLKNSNASYNITVYIFNNRSDYTKYNDLLGIDKDGGPDYITRGVTDYQNILTYKQSAMDFVLGHELGHIFQLRFSPSTTVRTLNILDTELIANVIGREVEEKNYKAICKQMGVDEYEDHGWMFQFKYKGTLYKYHKNLSEEEKFKAIQNVKNIRELVDEYEDHGSMFSFKYKGTTYNVRYKNFSEEEKFQIIKDIKNSHESLVSECDGLGNKNTTLLIYFDENKEISQMYFHNPDKNISKWLDKTLISRSKSKEDVDDADPKPGEEPEPESEKEPEEDISRSKPEQDVDEVDYTEGKEPEEDTQQPSNFLSSIIFPAIKSIIDSISSLFSWLFGSKEKEQSDNNSSLLNLSEEQSDDNPSLFKLDANELDHNVKPDANELGYDVRDHLSDNYNHYDEFM